VKLVKILKVLKTDKLPVLDKMHPILLKVFSTELAISLPIFRKSLQDKKVPDDWKKSSNKRHIQESEQIISSQSNLNKM
jgi:hypothetical protein